jgi:hypothetical protein
MIAEVETMDDISRPQRNSKRGKTFQPGMKFQRLTLLHTTDPGFSEQNIARCGMIRRS